MKVDNFIKRFSFIILAFSFLLFNIAKAEGNWQKYENNPVLRVGEAGSYDEKGVMQPSIIESDGVYWMYYTAEDANSNKVIALAQSKDRINWEKIGVVLEPSNEQGKFDRIYVKDPDVIIEGNTFVMWYSGYDGFKWRIGKAISNDGLHWEKIEGAGYGGSAFNLGGNDYFDYLGAQGPSVVKVNGTYYLYYYGTNDNLHYYVGLAVSPNSDSWIKVNGKEDFGSIFGPGGHGYDDSGALSPDVLYDAENNKFRMWYTGVHYCVSCTIYTIGYATSENGITWKRHGPVLSREFKLVWDAWNVFDTSTLKIGDLYEMFYSGTNTLVTQIGRATSIPLDAIIRPEKIDFYDVLIGSSLEKTIEFENTGVLDFVIDEISYQQNQYFQFYDIPDTPYYLDPGEKLRIRVQFSPLDLNQASNQLTFSINGGQLNKSIQIEGRGNYISIYLEDNELRTGEEHILNFGIMNPYNHPANLQMFLALEAFGNFYFYPEWTTTPQGNLYQMPTGFKEEPHPFISFEIIPEIPDSTYQWWSLLYDSESNEIVGNISNIEFTTEIYYRFVTTRTLQQWIEEGRDIVILDVRTPEEYCQGHIPGAINIPHYEIADRIDELNREDEIVAICQTGIRSDYALEILLDNGFRKLWNVANGMNFWYGETVPCK